jgi:hypothetical protein
MARGKVHQRQATPEERMFFESLLRLRAAYRSPATADTTPVISIRHAIATANAALGQSVSSRVTNLGITGN